MKQLCRLFISFPASRRPVSRRSQFINVECECLSVCSWPCAGFPAGACQSISGLCAGDPAILSEPAPRSSPTYERRVMPPPNARTITTKLVASCPTFRSVLLERLTRARGSGPRYGNTPRQTSRCFSRTGLRVGMMYCTRFAVDGLNGNINL